MRFFEKEVSIEDNKKITVCIQKSLTHPLVFTIPYRTTGGFCSISINETGLDPEHTLAVVKKMVPEHYTEKEFILLFEALPELMRSYQEKQRIIKAQEHCKHKTLANKIIDIINPVIIFTNPSYRPIDRK